MWYSVRYPSPLGELRLTSDGSALTGAWFTGQKYDLATVSGEELPGDGLPVLAEAARWLDAYFRGERPDHHSLPLAPQGGEFRQAVWDRLLAIPYGQVTTYGAIARELAQGLGRPMSAQAVGGAVGHNPISVIIPCHRVVGADGSLTGYAGGISRKLALLTLEGASREGLYLPRRGTAL